MSIFNFKKETKVYILYSGLQYPIEVGDITFSQTFTEESYTIKTIHTQQNNFEGSVINKANPSNFQFKLPLVRQSDHDILFELLLDYTADFSLKTFDLYIDTQSILFKIENCVLTSGSINFQRSEILSLDLSGQGTKLTVDDTGSYTIPGTPQSITASPNYNICKDIILTSSGYTMSDNIISCSVDLQNNISWVPYKTLQQALSAVDTATSMYPNTFVLNNRILAGSIAVYISDTNLSDLQEWDSSTSLRIQAGEDVGGTIYGVDIDMPNTTITNRINTGSVFTKSYDWRLTSNPSALSSIFSYITV